MKTAIYGAGFFGEIFCKEIEKNGKKIDFFIDQYIDKKFILNKQILRLKELDDQNIEIYLSITTPIVEEKVINDLKQKGFKKIFSFIETLNIFPNLIPLSVKHTKTWYGSKEEMLDYDKIRMFKNLLSDTTSVDILDNLVKFRENLIPTHYPVPDKNLQYFPSDLNLFNGIEQVNFVDAGAYTGDTVLEILKWSHKVNKKINYIASFEPDTKNIKKLHQNIVNLEKQYQNINFIIFPAGLWNKNQILKFNTNKEASSNIIGNSSKKEENIIQILGVSLDHTLYGAKPNFIKMDIEGAEYEALLGSAEIIRNFSPILAISLYHKPEDLWNIPLLINSINPNYDMHLRIYGQMALETVLYCKRKD